MGCSVWRYLPMGEVMTETGLPELPEGLVWAVRNFTYRADYVPENNYWLHIERHTKRMQVRHPTEEVTRQVKKRTWYGRAYMVDVTSFDEVRREYEVTDKNVIAKAHLGTQGADVTPARIFTAAEKLLAEYNETERVKGLLGEYPPKVLPGGPPVGLEKA